MKAHIPWRFVGAVAGTFVLVAAAVSFLFGDQMRGPLAIDIQSALRTTVVDLDMTDATPGEALREVLRQVNEQHPGMNSVRVLGRDVRGNLFDVDTRSGSVLYTLQFQQKSAEEVVKYVSSLAMCETSVRNGTLYLHPVIMCGNGTPFRVTRWEIYSGKVQNVWYASVWPLIRKCFGIA